MSISCAQAVLVHGPGLRFGEHRGLNPTPSVVENRGTETERQEGKQEKLELERALKCAKKWFLGIAKDARTTCAGCETRFVRGDPRVYRFV